MVLLHDLHDQRLTEALQAGGIAILRTDTLYGVVAVATNQAAVERVYEVKSRQPDKQLIVLISSIDDVFDSYPPEVVDRIKGLWPGKNTIVLPSQHAPDWLLRGGDSLAYRLPDSTELRELIAQTGPLVAPSANPESLPPAMTIDQATAYFGDNIDVYVDGGTVIDASPSNIYRLDNGRFEQLR